MEARLAVDVALSSTARLLAPNLIRLHSFHQCNNNSLIKRFGGPNNKFACYIVFFVLLQGFLLTSID